MAVQDIAAGIASSGALEGVAGRLGISPDQARTALDGVLQHVSGGGAVDSAAIGDIAARAGVDPATLQQFLPSVIALVQGHAAAAPEGDQGMVTGLLGSLGRMLPALDANQDGSIVDDVFRMASGLLGRKDPPPG